MNRQGASFSHWVGLGGVLITIILICSLFTNYVKREIEPFYPLYDDQNYYIAAAYYYHDLEQEKGFLHTIKANWFHKSEELGFPPSPNSQMSLCGSWLLNVFGDRRGSLLNLQLGSYLILLVTIYWVILQLTRNVGLALGALGMLLALRVPFVGPGGMSDFRMDFLATCWMGTGVSLWALYLQRPRLLIAILACLAMLIIIYWRIITLVYWLAPITLVGVFVISSYFHPRCYRYRSAVYPLLVSGLLIVLLLSWGWPFIHQYYFESQLGQTEIMARGADKTWQNVGNALAYYPRCLLEVHVGGWFLLIAGIVYVAVRSVLVPGSTLLPIRCSALMLALIALLFPLIVLTINPSRTPQVVGVSAIPLVLFMFLLIGRKLSRLPKDVNLCVGIVLLVVGLSIWSWNLNASNPFQGQFRQEALHLNSVFEDLFKRLSSGTQSVGYYSVCNYDQALTGYGVWFYGREHLHSKSKVICLFPRQITEFEPNDLLSWLHQSKIVIMPLHITHDHDYPYPLVDSLKKYFNLAESDVHARMLYQYSFEYAGTNYEVYEEP